VAVVVAHLITAVVLLRPVLAEQVAVVVAVNTTTILTLSYKQQPQELQIQVLAAAVAFIQQTAKLVVRVLSSSVMQILTQMQHRPLEAQHSPTRVGIRFTLGQVPVQSRSNHGNISLPLKCLWSLEPNGCTRRRYGR